MKLSSDLRAPPFSRRDDLREILHGVEVADPYRWLEDGTAPETRAWISAQHEYARPFLDIADREKIRARLAELMKTDALGVPVERNGYYFFGSRGK